MSAREHLNPQQFMDSPKSYQDAEGYVYDITPAEHDWSGGENTIALWKPHKDGLKRVGQMKWHPTEGHVTWIEVPEEERRNGHATRMWNMAHQVAGEFSNLVPPKHSPSQTPSGERWAESVG